MAKDKAPGDFPVGNQDPDKRGLGKRPERDSGSQPPKGPRQKPGHGDVTGDKK